MKLKTIMLVTVVLLALAALTTWWGNRTPEIASDDPLVGEPLVAAEALRGLAALEVRAGDGRVVRLEQASGGPWVVASEGGVPADVDRLRRTVQPLLQGRVARFVTARAERKEGLDLDRNALVLEGEGGQPILEVKIGRTATAGGVYIETGKEGRVYRLDETISVDATGSSWIDRTPLDFTPEDVLSVTVAFPKEAEVAPLTFSRETAEGDWTVAGAPEGSTVKASDLSRLLRNLGSLRMTRHVGRDDPEAIEAEAFQRTVQVKTFAGAEFAIALGRRPEGVAPFDVAADGAETEALFPAETEEGAEATAEPEPPPAGKPFVEITYANSDVGWAGVADRYAFEIAEWTFNQLPASPDALLNPPPPPPAPLPVSDAEAPVAEPAPAE